MQTFSSDGMNFFVRFGEVMSQITSAEAVYEVDLRKPFRELSSLYWRWSKDLMTNKPVLGHFKELCKLELSTYNTICEEIIGRLAKLRKELDRLYLIDTSQLNVAMEEARLKKVSIENDALDENRVEDCIKSMRTVADESFKTFCDWRAKRKNLERNALLKWVGGLGGGYTGIMLVYFQVLNNMKTSSDFTLGVVIPVGFGLLLLLFLFAIFSQE